MGHRKLVRILELILYRENVYDRFPHLDGMIFVKLFGSSLVKRGVFEATRSPSTNIGHGESHINILYVLINLLLKEKLKE